MLRELQVMIDVPAHRGRAAEGFWTAALGWPLGAPWAQRPEFRSFKPGDAPPYVHFQVAGVDQPRVHLDVDVDDRDADGDRLVELGATRGPRCPRWDVMTSPGGMPFCLVDHRTSVVPAASRFGAHRSRLVQVCIDAPADRLDAEVRFWREATQWAWSASDAAEFAGTLRPTPNRVQLLFQRLDEPSGPVRAHVDLGTDDRRAEVDRLVALGARPGPVGDGWQVLTDPAGMEFCVTDNPPE